MKWRGRGGAGRIEDRRGRGGSLGGGIPLGKAGGGVGAIVLIVLYLIMGGLPGGGGGGGFGIDPGTGQFPQAPGASSTDLEQAPADDAGKFVDFVAGDVDATWTKLFAESGQTYEPATIVLYEQGVQSGCGSTPSTVGPFYCPNDRKVYLDLVFMGQLQQRLDAPGDFAQAYIVAHEIGHHVQNLLGVMEDVNLQSQESPDDANELSVRLELQADCLAGIWGHSAYAQGDLLETGDLEEGLAAAAAVGDDRIQQQAGQEVNPEAFTHGTGEQRVKWFRKGFDTGDPTACDTFEGDV
ncbi:MAG TPA: neutral zinc metallopeptidase [Gaiellaceae bacterium]|nr:neutral zinc metallopeptidase [Gaiellaceae bacterium]